jgi:PadR family transcriptional regulator, regulatory protein PadR
VQGSGEYPVVQGTTERVVGDEARSTRLLRGILDACLLALVVEQDRYGYELTSALHEAGLPLVKEGSIYPLLARLERRGWLDSYRVPAPGAPPRRYYRITSSGRRELAAAQAVWTEVATGVDAVFARANGRDTSEEPRDDDG